MPLPTPTQPISNQPETSQSQFRPRHRAWLWFILAVALILGIAVWYFIFRSQDQALVSNPPQAATNPQEAEFLEHRALGWDLARPKDWHFTDTGLIQEGNVLIATSADLPQAFRLEHTELPAGFDLTVEDNPDLVDLGLVPHVFVGLSSSQGLEISLILPDCAQSQDPAFIVETAQASSVRDTTSSHEAEVSQVVSTIQPHQSLLFTLSGFCASDIGEAMDPEELLIELSDGFGFVAGFE